MHERITDLSEADREKITRLLKKQVGGEHAYELAALFYNALCNYEYFSYQPCAPTTVSNDEIPF
jgi:hypothetical protein